MTPQKKNATLSDKFQNKILKSQEKSQSLPVVHMYALVPGLVHAL